MSEDTAVAARAQDQSLVAGKPSIEEQAALVRQYYSMAFQHNIDPTEAAEQLKDMIIAAAEIQITNETDKDSPWFIARTDSTEIEEKKKRIKETEVARRALEIAAMRTLSDETAAIYVVQQLQKRRAELFPADGTWTDLETLVRDILPPSTAGAALQTLSFLSDKETKKLVEEAGITPAEIVELTKKRGLYTLGRMRTAMTNNVEANMPKEERIRVTKEIFEAAGTQSKNKFLAEHSGNRSIPPVEYTEMRDTISGETYLVLLAKDSRQYDSLKSRLANFITPSDTLAFGGVRARALYDLWVLMNQTAPQAEEAIARTRDLMVQAALQDSVCHAMYRILLNHKGTGMTVADFEKLTDEWDAGQIATALNTLVGYGIIGELVQKRKRMYYSYEQHEVEEEETEEAEE